MAEKSPLQNESPAKAPGFFDTLFSVLAAFFGVQTQTNRERDFKHGKAWHFIAMGLFATALFVLVLVVIVKIVLRAAVG